MSIATALKLTFGEWMTATRKRAGLSQKELADRLGVTRQSIGAWEANRFKPALDPAQYQLLCSALGVTPDDLAEAFRNG